MHLEALWDMFETSSSVLAVARVQYVFFECFFRTFLTLCMKIKSLWILEHLRYFLHALSSMLKCV